MPATCRRCGHDLPQQAGADAPEPSWHQVAELPALIAQVTEYQGQARTCPACQTVTHAAIPADATRGTCRELLAWESSLWTFAFVEGEEPSNNHAERVLRGAVLWRKGSFGSRSEGGCRFVERILTVVQTLRLQGRPVLTYLHEALCAHRQRLPAPKLLPAD